MDTESTGPDEVRVEFESDDHKSEIRIRWDGDFVVEVDEDESSSGSG
jgi:hypothetical protein